MNGKIQHQEIPLHLCQVLEEEFENLHKRPGVAGEVAQDWEFHEGHVKLEKLAATLRAAHKEWEAGRAPGRGWQETISTIASTARVKVEEAVAPVKAAYDKLLERRRGAAGDEAKGEGGGVEATASESGEPASGSAAVMSVEGEPQVSDVDAGTVVLSPEVSVQVEDSSQVSAAPTELELRAVKDLTTYLALRYPGLREGPTEKRLGILNLILQDRQENGEKNGPEFTVYRREWFERRPLREETRGLLETGWGKSGEVAFDDEGGATSDLRRFRRLLLEGAFPAEIERVYELRLDAAVHDIHGLTDKRAAICLSGGGIRSGTFALGVLQSLARHGFLEQFHYLSTVSGGGYVGGWLTAWVHRHRRGRRGVFDELNGVGRDTKVEPEPRPLRHLRDFSNFITPRTGILSADSWTFIVIYIRNLLLNWVVLIPLLASVLMIPRVANAVILAEPAWRVLAGLALCGVLSIVLLKPDRKTLWWMFALGVIVALVIAAGHSRAPGGSTPRTVRAAYVMGTLLVAGALLSAYALAFMRLNRPSNQGVLRPGGYWDKRRDQNSFLWMCMLPLTVSAVTLAIFWAWFRQAMFAAKQTDVDIIILRSWPDEGFVKWANRWLLKDWSELGAFLLYGALVGFAGWLIYSLLAASSWMPTPASAWRTRKTWLLTPREMWRRWLPTPASASRRLAHGRHLAVGILKNGLRELLVTVGASMLGAVLLYAAAVNVTPFYTPVVPPFETYADGSVSGAMLPHTEWRQAEVYTLLAFPAYLFIFFLGLTLFTGFTSRRQEKPPRLRRRYRWEKSLLRKAQKLTAHPLDHIYIRDEDREWLARACAWIFIVAGGWLFLGGLVIFGPLLYFDFGNWLAAAGGASGLLALLGGGSSRTPGGSKQEGKLGWLQKLGVNVLVVAAFVFFCCIIIAVSILTGSLIAWLAKYLPAYMLGQCSPKARFANYVSDFCPDGGAFANLRGYVEIPARSFAAFSEHYPFESRADVFRVLHFPTWLFLLALALLLQGFGRLFAGLINLNKFSLHAGYRDRIIRAFLGASRLRGERDANPFTGFDPRDDLHMGELHPLLLRESDFDEQDGLSRFVTELARPPEERGTVAAYLRQEIELMGGESQKYFNDPPGSIENNPSFRSALFADLNTILQERDLPEPVVEKKEAAEGDAEAAAPEESAERYDAGRIKRNRERLQRAFDYIHYPPQQPYRLLHVVNMALNLVRGKRLAWQQRRAQSFTATPLHSGTIFGGYRRTHDYGGKNGIRLGTAVAISGAAASSNMGYFSPSPFVTFVLTFFNARLGWWLGNTGVYGADTFFRSHPTSALSPIIDEAFGLTDAEHPYVLLSDGGHFENLGLYEMVLRRCRYIFVVDGSADPEGGYSDLGAAVRKIRIDFGVPIEFPSPFPILTRPESETKSGAYFAVGNIRYGVVDVLPGKPEDKSLTGKLIYIKPAIYNEEPRDIYNYSKGDPTFPHESTADQFFDEPQFESHRMLGHHILEALWRDAARPKSEGGGDCEAGDLRRFVAWLDVKAEREKEKAADEERDKAVMLFQAMLSSAAEGATPKQNGDSSTPEVEAAGQQQPPPGRQDPRT